ncbi:MAG: NVEALA domain-containing protein [Bacteroidaceae bacterium]|nr:NVEALA domain-containing protein [Bacteroidaceae bacterium]
MNKKSLYSIAVAAAFVAGYSAYNEYGRTRLSGALLANVEALATGEEDDWEDLSNPCSGGLGIYATVGTSHTTTTMRIHYSGGNDSVPGIDMVYDVEIDACIATGVGKRKGIGNVEYDRTYGQISYEPCLGNAYHSSDI